MMPAARICACMSRWSKRQSSRRRRHPDAEYWIIGAAWDPGFDTGYSQASLAIVIRQGVVGTNGKPCEQAPVSTAFRPRALSERHKTGTPLPLETCARRLALDVLTPSPRLDPKRPDQPPR
jgi:hypothetical protein